MGKVRQGRKSITEGSNGRAKRNVQSRAAALRSRRELLEQLEQLRERLRAKYGEFSDSTPYIREERDQRG